jgi:glycosyltransferase involved in cell wall biosynthesis
VTARIAIVLPRKESFGRDRFGAVALTVELYVRHSAYRGITEILGMPAAAPRDPERFRAVMPRDAWWRRRNLGWAEGCAAYLAEAPPRHLDIHNRVELFRHLARRFPDAAASLWFHNDPQEMRGARRIGQRRGILAHAHRVICVSEFLRARFLAGLTDGGERVLVLPNTIEPAPAASARERLIVFVGRLIPEKGALLFAEALAQALPGLPGWRAIMLGAGRTAESPEAKKIRAAVSGLDDRVALPGFVSHEQVLATLAKAAIAVVPSLWDEPFGRAALEAMAAGCAVIATLRGGLSEVVAEAGLALDPPTAPKLAELIRKLAGDDRLREEMQRRSLARAAIYDASGWAARLDSLRRDSDPRIAG